MKIQLKRFDDNSDTGSISNLMHVFISEKMAALERDENIFTDAAMSEMEKKKYRASLLMLFCRLNIKSTDEIARSTDIEYDLLCEWNRDQAFQELVSINYRGFLEFVVDIFA